MDGLIQLYKDKKTCCTCKYFHQHYVYSEIPMKNGERWIPINGGHCTVKTCGKFRKYRQTCELYEKDKDYE